MGLKAKGQMNAADATLIGIPVAQLVAFALAIIASYLSARWATAESRKHFHSKTESDERAAASELIPLLLKFALDCDRKKTNLSMFMSSDGYEGIDEQMTGIVFDPAIHASAARLGPRVTERAIKLEMTKTRAESGSPRRMLARLLWRRARRHDRNPHRYSAS
jgi:hypothetical protein